MGISVTALRNKLVQGGARPSLFYAKIDFPTAGDLEELRTATGLETKDISFFIKSAQIPESTIASIPINFLGREFKVPSIDRTFADWSITVLNDTNFKLRNAFERWQNGINNMSDNEGLSNPVDYQVDAFVDQLDRNGNTLKSYTLRGAFPVDIAAIDLNFATNDEVETFGVTFQYQYFETNTTT